MAVSYIYILESLATSLRAGGHETQGAAAKASKVVRKRACLVRLGMMDCGSSSGYILLEASLTPDSPQSHPVHPLVATANGYVSWIRVHGY